MGLNVHVICKYICNRVDLMVYIEVMYSLLEEVNCEV
jgi:hypothetical protein